MSALRIILLPMVCLMLSACSQYLNRYVEREDTITLSAGDAVASNAAVQIPTPWPRYSNDTNIAFDGEKIGRAVKRYREGGKAAQPNEAAPGAGFAPSIEAPSGFGAGSTSAPAPQAY